MTRTLKQTEELQSRASAPLPSPLPLSISSGKQSILLVAAYASIRFHLLASEQATTFYSCTASYCDLSFKTLSQKLLVLPESDVSTSSESISE